jgi:hypothetical protein
MFKEKCPKGTSAINISVALESVQELLASSAGKFPSTPSSSPI